MVEFFQDFYKNIVAFDLIYLIITLYTIIQCSNKGFVYFIKEEAPGHIKIGFSEKHPEGRLK